MKKYSLLGLALVAASTLTALITQSKAATTEKKQATGKLIVSTTGGSAGVNETCINDEAAEHCDYTLTGDAAALSGSTRLVKGTGTAAVGIYTENVTGNPRPGTTVY